jgi:hypothetical protein
MINQIDDNMRKFRISLLVYAGIPFLLDMAVTLFVGIHYVEMNPIIDVFSRLLGGIGVILYSTILGLIYYMLIMKLTVKIAFIAAQIIMSLHLIGFASWSFLGLIPYPNNFVILMLIIICYGFISGSLIVKYIQVKEAI